jgi:hypothetical protein
MYNYKLQNKLGFHKNKKKNKKHTTRGVILTVSFMDVWKLWYTGVMQLVSTLVCQHPNIQNGSLRGSSKLIIITNFMKLGTIWEATNYVATW